jgi:hypothetical protein
MKHQLVESRMQGWRALAVAHNGAQHLLYVGMSFEQVKKNYQNSFSNLLTDEEQLTIFQIQIQRWSGVPDSGKWVTQDIARFTIKPKDIKDEVTP